MTPANSEPDVPDPDSSETDPLTVDGHRLFLNSIAWRLCQFSARVSICRIWQLEQWQRQYLLQRYIAAWFVALCLMFALTPQSGPVALTVTGLAFYRLQDLLFGSLDDALDFGTFQRFNWRGRLLILLVNIVQVVLIFAIADLVLASSPAGPSVPIHRFDYLFQSWTNFPPLGGGSTAVTTTARMLTMTETGVGFLMVAMALSAFISKRK